jgi:agmatinase
MATRVICDAMGHLVVSGQLPRREKPSYICDEEQVVDEPWQ